MVQYTVINVVTFLLGIVFLYNGYRIVRQGREDLVLFLVSTVIGGGLMAVAISPDLFESIATGLGLDLQERAILVMSNLTLFFIVTYLLNKIGKLNKSVSRLNEELSLLKTDTEREDD